MQITKEKLQTIVDNAPQGTEKVQLIKGLYDRGITVQGVDSFDAQKYFNAYESTQIKKQQAVQRQNQPVQENVNLGTGFNPSFESEQDDNVIESVAKTIGNVPKSGYMLGKDVLSAIANPIETTKTIATLIQGTAGKGAERFLNNTGFGQAILEKMNEVRKANGVAEMPRGADGKLIIPPTEEIEVANQVGAYFKDRYGSWDNFKESSVEDPVGVVSDIASVVSGVGFAVKQTGNVSRVNSISQAGQKLQTFGNALEPTTAAARGVLSTVSKLGDTLPGRIIEEAAPTAGRFAEGEIVKALDLTQDDVRRISQKTGNDVSDFVSRNNLLKETPGEIAMALDDFKTSQYDLVRSEVAKVPDVYTKETVPRINDALSAVKEVVDDVPGLEDVALEVNRLLEQPNYSLSDVQRAKEILDANVNIYTRAGDVSAAKRAQGLANVRADLRSFIETEVARATNGQTNIQKLNNDVATARELADAIELRETRGLTRNYSPLTSTILGGAAFAGTGDIFTALGVAGVSKIIQTPSFRIAVARALNATPVEDLARWSKEIAEGNLSPQTRQSLAQILETAKNNTQFVQSGAQVIAEAQPSEEATTTQQ